MESTTDKRRCLRMVRKCNTVPAEPNIFMVSTQCVVDDLRRQDLKRVNRPETVATQTPGNKTSG